ncbi:scarecrow-like protein 6 [Mangifera indica]|uniref:scarecrow-like protein 6 n=1 Tax=Mangifera indica TaxID=29780 RepID=UPI001CF957CC|nr:scarecrow-like protein 6 [Mangifera indica]
MKAMPLAFEGFQGKGPLDFSSSSSSDSLASPHQQQQQQQQRKQQQNWLNNNKEGWCYVGSEPTSVLDSRRSPSPPTSSSTLSSSLGGNNNGGGGGIASTDTTGVTAAAYVLGNPEKCGLGVEDWEVVLPGSPSQEPSIVRLIMGDMDDPSLGLNKILHTGGLSHQDMDFNAGFGVVDQASFAFDPNIDTSLQVADFTHNVQANNARVGSVPNPNHIFSASATNQLPVPPLAPTVSQQQQPPPMESLEEKPQIFNPQLMIHQNQAQFTQNPAVYFSLSYPQLQEHHLLSAPPPKRVNLGPNNQAPKVAFPDLGQQELFLRRQQQLQMLQQQPSQTMGVSVTATKQKMVNDELANQQFQEEIIDQVFKAAELIETGNPVLAQGILARLNHQLSPIGKPFQRAAFYFKEALQFLLHMNTTNSSTFSAYNVIFKISAYKSFSEVSPILQFANFTCNQVLLEASEGFDRIHIIDFDIGYGGQWASLMQELVLRSQGPPSLKITAFASPSSHDELELCFTQENLKHFASEINIPFEIEILSLESINSASCPLPLHVLENEAIAVNLPIASFSNYPATLPLVLHFVKQLSPKIVVSLDKGCDRADVPFPHHIIHALQSYSGLLESLDAVNMNFDTQQKIERFLLHPCIEKLVLGRHRAPECLPPWRGLFVQSGFSPLTFSNFTESQADCLVQRTLARGFHVEKRQSSLVLCWQRKELISASAWRC